MDIIYRHKNLFSRSLFSIIILCIDKALTLIISVLILFRLIILPACSIRVIGCSRLFN
jgi:hypothetical protein